jgi:hypothetical protein
MKNGTITLLSLLVAIVIAGCSQREPAQKAIDAAESALSTVRESAQKYVPDQLKAVDAQIAAAKDSVAKGDYAAALAAGPKITSAIGDLKNAASAKKAEVEAALAKAKDVWGPMAAGLPKMVDSIRSRVDTLSKSRRLPAGVTKEGLASAKSGLDSLKAGLAEATGAASSGDFTTAVAKGEELKAKAAEIMKSIGMPAG